MPPQPPAQPPAHPPAALPSPQHACSAGAAGERRPPLRRLLLALCAALALHALLLGAAPKLPGLAPEPPGAPTALQTRQVFRPPPPGGSGLPPVAPLPPQAPAAAAPPSTVTAPAAPAQAALSTEPRAPAAAETRLEAASAPAGAVVAETETEAATAPATAAAVDPSTTAPAAVEEGPAPPVYRTQMAPPATLLFELKRGLAAGQAVLQWRPEPRSARYTLTLQAQAFGVAVAGWNSRGQLDTTGLAPERYAETRRNREVRATNFQREQGKVSFSALALEFPLTPGMQDRSSWLLQLGAILQAQPELARPGAQVTLVVVGTRGAPEPWVFTVVDRGDLVLAGAAAADPGGGPAASGSGNGSRVADAVQLLREPRRPYDTRARVWLDPARHHLPVKVQLLVAATGEGQDFELRELSLP